MIIRTDFQQGSVMWLEARLGIPTASEFHRIVTPGGHLSKQARAYAMRLATERLLNRPLDSIDNLEWVTRGKETEPEAVAFYEAQHDVTTERVAFVTTDDGRIGASPDRLLAGRKIGLEIKCPSPQVHLSYLIDGPGADYKPQVQGQMLVAELEAVDFFSYHPEMPPVLMRWRRDPAYIAILADALAQFCGLVDQIEAAARSRGAFVKRKSVTTEWTQAAEAAAANEIPEWLGLPP